MAYLIRRERSIIPACDVSLEVYEKIIRETAGIDGVGAYKVGFQLGLLYGLPKVVETAKKYTDKPVIYDHQKAGTDIPDTGKNFAETLAAAGVDAVILFPQAGPETERAWIRAAQQEGLGVIVGGWMTHAKYVASEGGYLLDDAVLAMYANAAKEGVSDFVVPGNKPDVIAKIRALLEGEGVKPVFYAPGFVAQGGEISEAAKAAGKRWHAIVGRGIYTAEDIKAAALEHAKHL
jgi:orotidine-5'-phosphate decarboxylase